MPQNRVPNESALRRAYAGTQDFYDTPVAPTFKLYGQMVINSTRQITESDDRAGTRFVDYEPTYGPWTADGTYQVNLSYEDLAILPRYAVRGGISGVSDANTTPSYLYSYTTPAVTNELEAMTVEHSFPGIPERAETVMFNDFTISADADDAQAVWKWNGNLWVRFSGPLTGESGTATAGTTTSLTMTGAGWTIDEWAGAYVYIRSGAREGDAVEVASNTADTLTFSNTLAAAIAAGDEFDISGVFTSGITDRSRTLIKGPGTTVYIDDEAGTIGTTEYPKWISWSVTYQNNLSSKRFGSDIDRVSDKVGLGIAKVTGQIRLEFDDPLEYQHFSDGDMRRIRIQQTDTTLVNTSPATYRQATIDVPLAAWSQVTKDERGSNITATFAFVGFVDTTAGYPVRFQSLVPMAALP
jgi:hypothetical protein